MVMSGRNDSMGKWSIHTINSLLPDLWAHKSTKCVFVLFSICVDACTLLCSSLSGLDYKAPLFLAWAPSLGLVKQMAFGGFSPGHVPWPLSGLQWLVEPLFLASSAALLSINGSPRLPHLHSFKLWNRAPSERGKAVPNLPQLTRSTSHWPLALLFSAGLSLKRALHSNPVGPGLCSVGRILPQSFFCLFVLNQGLFGFFFLLLACWVFKSCTVNVLGWYKCNTKIGFRCSRALRNKCFPFSSSLFLFDWHFSLLTRQPQAHPSCRL